MDKEAASALLSDAGATREEWRYDWGDYGDEPSWWNVYVEGPPPPCPIVAADDAPPTVGAGRLLAAAPELARWGIAQAEEVERLRARVAELEAENADFRTMVYGTIPTAEAMAATLAAGVRR